jgi:signal peptidase I
VKRAAKSDQGERPKTGANRVSSTQATRETVESVVIAVVLAFLFRGFVAEAFVIPTGSMAPTLQGRHIDVTCPQCSYSYQTGASEENEENIQEGRSGIVQETYCPICRFPLKLDRSGNPNHRSFNGDRILVSKFAYELSPPERWDVIVFKYPGNAKQNYIKRLVGLPNELIRIRNGDVFVSPWLFNIDRSVMNRVAIEGSTDELRAAFRQAGWELGEASRIEKIQGSKQPLTISEQSASSIWNIEDPVHGRNYIVRMGYGDEPAAVFAEPRILRKPPEKQNALLQIVHDTNYPSKLLDELGWPSRWRDESETPGWRAEDDGGFVTDGSVDEWSWLRYRHSFPSQQEWRTMLEQNQLPETIDRQDGELITDYYAYNDSETTARSGPNRSGLHWVGDLAVECEFEVTSDQGELAFDLVEGGVHFRCTIDVAKGVASLSKSDGHPFSDDEGRSSERPSARTEIQGQGGYRVRLVNADDQVRLWVDGDLVEFDGPTTYTRVTDPTPFWLPTDPGDLAPAGIGTRGAALRVSRLRVLRDVYYLAIVHPMDMLDYANAGEGQVVRILRQPSEWNTTSLFTSRRTAEFVIGPDRFFPLGDNSPHSMDGRLWNFEPSFDRDMLIGKAILIYWPHSWRRPIPYWPNFSRMGLIR